MLRFIVQHLIAVFGPDREEGQALTEYGLILALIAIAALTALTFLGLAVSGVLDDVRGALGGS